MRKAGRRSEVAATTWSTSATPNRSAKPSESAPGRYSGARPQCSRTNRSGSPTQRRSALPVGAVGIGPEAAVRVVGPVGVGPVGVGPVGVAAVRHVGAVRAIGTVGPVDAVGAVGAVGTVGAVGVPAVGVAAGVDVVAVAWPLAGGALRGGDVVVSEGRVVSAHQMASSFDRIAPGSADGPPSYRNLP